MELVGGVVGVVGGGEGADGSDDGEKLLNLLHQHGPVLVGDGSGGLVNGGGRNGWPCKGACC